MRILAINPGSTSTKIAVFDDNESILSVNIKHGAEEIGSFPKIIDQYGFRKQVILDQLDQTGIAVGSLDAVVGRGGLVKPIQGGVYLVNDAMIADLKAELNGSHASNLGSILAREIAQLVGNGVKAFTVDPVVVDEMHDLARPSGIPELPRKSIFHALNQKAVARRYCKEAGVLYEEVNLIVAHLGGGISIGAHQMGAVVDVNNALDGEGPFSPERSGGVPVGQLVNLCFSGEHTQEEIKKKITGKGGFVAYLGTNNALEVENRRKNGDREAIFYSQAMAYQVAKEIGALAAVLKGEVRAIIVTSGMAYDQEFVGWITERVSFIAPVVVYPGEDEMVALAENALMALKGELPVKEY